MSLDLVKDKLKTKVYRENISLFIEREFGEEMDQKKKNFLEQAKNLNFDRFLITAARGFGKTWLLAKLALWSTTVIPDFYGEPYRVSILGGSREQSNKAYDQIRYSISQSDYVEKRVESSIKTKTSFKDRSQIRSLAASSKSIRGSHAQALLGDEWAELDRSLITAATESLEEYRTEKENFPARFVIVSTPHVYDSFFVDHFHHPEKWGFKTYQWKAIDSYNKSEKEVEDAKERLDTRTFKREWMGEPVSMRSTLLDHEDIQRSIIREEPELTLDSYITAGCDFGQKHPSTMVIVQRNQGFDYVIDARKWKEKKYEWVKDRILELYDKYEVDTIMADASHQEVIERIRDAGAHIRSVSFSGGEKENMITNALFKFENGRVKIPHRFKDLIEECKIYHRDRREKDDLWDGLILALKGQKRAPRKRGRIRKEGESLVSLGGQR